MPTLGAHFADDAAETVKGAARAAGQRVGAYIGDAIRERMRREGYLPGTPAHDVRAEALATANLIGPEATLAALRALRGEDDKQRGPAAAA